MPREVKQEPCLTSGSIAQEQPSQALQNLLSGHAAGLVRLVPGLIRQGADLGGREQVLGLKPRNIMEHLPLQR